MSGCSSTIQVTSNVSRKNGNVITEKSFIENVRGRTVTVALKTGQSKYGAILSMRDSLISFTEDRDTIDIPRKDIQFIAYNHRLLGAIFGLPIGLIPGGLFGADIASASSSDEKNKIDLSAVGGFIIGGIIGSISGTAIGIYAPPTTTYEFDSSGEIYEKQHAP